MSFGAPEIIEPIDPGDGSGFGGGGGGSIPPPSPASGDWALIADFAGDVTPYKLVNFSGLNTSGVLDLGGTYTILDVGADFIVLSNPVIENSDWGDFVDSTAYASATLSITGDRWVGPFTIDLDGLDTVLLNFEALAGLYSVSSKKGKQRALSVSIEVEIVPIDQDGDPLGAAEFFTTTLIGSAKEKQRVAKTLECSITPASRVSVRARRTSPTDIEFDGTIVDEIKWRDGYGMSQIYTAEFGDITTVHTRTYATAGATSIKARRFNLLATRKLPERIAGDEFGPAIATDSAADIIAAMAIDPFIGRRLISEIDHDSLYDTIDDVRAHFGDDLAAEFGFTFDDNDISFEESAQLVAQAVFCRAYRQGRVLRLAFERARDDSALIFNARNVLPQTQIRTVRFGPLDDHDGIELDYVGPIEGEPLTFALPETRLATSPRSIEIGGIRSYQLAYWHSWRALNKIRYQNIATEFEATQEAALIIPQDRVLIEDMTRPNILQGEIVDQIGTALELSHDAALDPDLTYTIFIQHTDGSTEALGCTAGPTDRYVEISSAARAPLSIDPRNFARATYMIVADTDVQTKAFLVTEREPQSNFTETVRAVNYSFLYYQNDQLALWLGFLGDNFFDSGPYRLDGTGAGGAATIADDDRGKRVYNGPGGGASVSLAAFDPPASYTKACWVKRADLATAGQLLGNAHEAFGFAAGAALQAGHGGVDVEAAWPDASGWHFAAIAYDAEAASMALYIDGLAADQAVDVAPRTIAQLIAFSGLSGRADDLRLWHRALSKSEIATLYRAGLRPYE